MTNEPIQTEKRKKLRSWLIIAGVIALVSLVALLKNTTELGRLMNGEPVEERLETLRAAGEPVVVFFHSPDCSSCEQVQESLDTVYPEFESEVTLLDLDVTDLRYREFVQRTGVQITPTLLLVDAVGNEKLIVGEISPQDLRRELALLSGGAP